MPLFFVTCSIRRLASCLVAAIVTVACASTSVADELVSVSGESVQGTLSEIAADGTLKGKGIPDGWKIDSLLSLRTTHPVKKIAKPAVIVHLAAGGELYATRAIIQNEKLEATCSFGEIELPIESIRAVVYQPGNAGSKTRSSIASPSTENDQIIAATDNGPQSASGILQSVVDGKVSMDFQGKTRSLSLNRVIAVVIADLGLKLGTGTKARCQFVDGSMVTGVVSQLSDGKLQIKLAGAGSLTTDWQQVASLSIQSDRLIYLSDLDPTDSEHQPVVTSPREWRRDRSVLGNPLTFIDPSSRKPIVYAKGIGMHSYSRLVFEIPEGFDRFVALVGIDAETEGKGDCVFTVRKDGIEIWSKSIKATDGTVEVDLDVSDAKEISLVVETGKQLDMGDHANWANARLLKTK